MDARLYIYIYVYIHTQTHIHTHICIYMCIGITQISQILLLDVYLIMGHVDCIIEQLTY